MVLSCATLAPRLSFSALRYSEEIFLQLVVNPTLLSYKASINNLTRNKKQDVMGAAISYSVGFSAKGSRDFLPVPWGRGA